MRKTEKINKTQFIYLCTPVTINPLLTKCFSNNNHYTIFKGSLYKYITENVCVCLTFFGHYRFAFLHFHFKILNLNFYFGLYNKYNTRLYSILP